MFDPNQFLSTSVEGAMSTEAVPVPEGEFKAVIENVKGRQAGESSIMDVTWALDDSRVIEVTGRDKNTVRQSIFLDINANGTLDLSKGKNVQLGKLREALGQNTGIWNPGMLIGNVAKVLISHRIYEGNTYADVKGVSKA